MDSRPTYHCTLKMPDGAGIRGMAIMQKWMCVCIEVSLFTMGYDTPTPPSSRHSLLLSNDLLPCTRDHHWLLALLQSHAQHSLCSTLEFHLLQTTTSDMATVKVVWSSKPSPVSLIPLKFVSTWLNVLENASNLSDLDEARKLYPNLQYTVLIIMVLQ